MTTTNLAKGTLASSDKRESSAITCNMQNALRQIDQLVSSAPIEEMTNATISREMSEACTIITH